MRAIFRVSDGTTDTLDIKSDRVYEEVASQIVKYNPPCNIDVTTEVGFLSYVMTTRSGTILLNETRNTVGDLPDTVYPHKYLTCVEYGYNDFTGRDKNHYKFYELEKVGNEVVATYGRIGSTAGERFGQRQCKYPLSMFWIKYAEKIEKGYTDQSDVYIMDEKSVDAAETKTAKVRKKTLAARLYEQLMSFCTKRIVDTCRSTIVTPSMVSKSKELLNELCSLDDVDAFNQTLVKLLAISPRRVSQVAELLAEDKDDFPEIIDREESLINAMNGLLGTKDNTQAVSDFGNIKIEETSAEERDMINAQLTPELRARVCGTWKVVSPAHTKHFEAYCKKNNIKKTMLLWHGSRNENWLSIIKQGLLLTSCRGTYYAKGNDSIGFMGLYETAHGNPKYVYRSGQYSESSLRREGCDCIHAKAGQSLIHDEIVYYNESAMVLRYLVRFAS